MKDLSFEHAFEQMLLHRLQQGSVLAFCYFYRHYREDIWLFACKLLADDAMAAGKVDELFEDLWLSATFRDIAPPIEAYLFGRIREKCELKWVPSDDIVTYE